MTISSFNNQFQLNKEEKDAVEWAMPLEFGQTMFHVINVYTKAAQYPELPADSGISCRSGWNDIGDGECGDFTNIGFLKHSCRLSGLQDNAIIIKWLAHMIHMRITRKRLLLREMNVC